MADPKITNTSKVGYKPDIKAPVKGVSIDIGNIPPLGLTDFRAPNAANNIPAEDQALIAEYMQDYTEVKGDLDAIDAELDRQLAPLAIPYDPARFAALADAHHHICGRPGALNVITYDDIKARWRLEGMQVANALTVPETLDQMALMDATELEARSLSKTNQMISKMLVTVAREILFIVLDFTAKMLSPLKSIKFVKALPKLVERAAKKVRGTRTDPNQLDSFLSNIRVNDEGDTNDSLSEQLAEAGGGYLPSLKELTQAVVEELPPECLQHTSTWNTVVESMVRDTKYAPAYYAKRSNMAMQARLESINKIAALGIPEGHVATFGSTQLRYTNPLPEEYLRARADGSTRFGALSKGLNSSVKQVKDTFIPRMREILRNLSEDPTLLCCLLRNLLVITSLKKLKKVLLYIQALLTIWRNLLALDISKELARLGNLIIDLVNRLLQSIFSLYITFFNAQLNKYALQVKDLVAIKKISPECRPWNLLIDLAADILSEMIQKVFDYLGGFFGNFNLDIQNLNVSNEKIAKLAQIDQFLRIINKILEFNAAWAACVEQRQDPIVILRNQNRVSNTATGLRFNALAATSINEGIGLNSNAGNEETNQDSENEPNGFNLNAPNANEGVQILLTNFVGLTPDAAKGVIQNMDDCSCDKSLSSDEISAIEKILKE